MLRINIPVLKNDRIAVFVDGVRIKTTRTKVSSKKSVKLMKERVAILPDSYEISAEVDLPTGEHKLQIKQVDILDSRFWFLKLLNPISGVIYALSDKKTLGLDGEKGNTVFLLSVMSENEYNITFNLYDEEFTDGDFSGRYSSFKTEKNYSFCQKEREIEDKVYNRRWKLVNVFSNFLLTAILSLVIYFYSSAAAESIKTLTTVVGIVVTCLIFILSMLSTVFALPKAKFINKKD